ncbi:MAG: sodium:proton antiporter [Gammaproteobacteria bacterium]|nr:MAG: sodium:proton antiporter [Gammaproteobacteria bacterium]
MSLFEIISLLLSFAAVFSYINYKYIKLPTTIGIMLLSLLFSLALLLFGEFGFSLDEQATALVKSIDFNEALLHGMLSFLLFAGALHVNINDLREQKWLIATLATVGVISSTFIIGTVMYYILQWLGIPVEYMYCLVFGALISPTDPIAVMGILKLVGAPKTLETKIAGESLFNDGVGVVVFLVLLGIAAGGDEMTTSHVIKLFSIEAIGGVFFGLGLGLLGFFMLRGVDNYQVEALITLALVSGGYAFAESIHVSAPIAIVVAGLFIGNQGRMLAMSDNTRERLDDFWELIDEILNAILFLLIGVELLILTFTNQFMIAGLLAIPVVLLARFVCVGIPIKIMSKFRTFSPYVTTILTWGGLRGGISVALALSIPDGPAREPLLVITYFIVVFSILVQGLTIKKVLAFSQK